VRFASLGSGSQGNALLVEAGSTRIMLDCGFSVAETTRRLGRLGLRPENLTAIVVTHEHDDHIGGVARFARKHRITTWMTPGTYRGLEKLFEPDIDLRLINGYAAFAIGDLCVEPYPVPHDAREPAQYVFSDGNSRLGVLTDAGYPTPHIRACLDRCDALVMECNHDSQLLELSDYPPSIKQRIAGRMGHLDNAQAGRLLSSLDQRRLKHVLAAHLSETNNRPQLAQLALAQALGCHPDWIGIVDQHGGSAWRELL
jgi:phosphoribosyl 1,2-cyclic phosphodiesterase